ncbi:hypothetical protein HDU96_007664 [Phlyctochytrium bullatum]|nr:hypothetical protein HDU96_007664 [Phlyctochytrium bullatum]
MSIAVSNTLFPTSTFALTTTTTIASTTIPTSVPTLAPPNASFNAFKSEYELVAFAAYRSNPLTRMQSPPNCANLPDPLPQSCVDYTSNEKYALSRCSSASNCTLVTCGTFLWPTSWCGPSNRQYACGYTTQSLCNVILVSETEAIPFLDSDPDASSSMFKEKIYVKYGRRVNLAGYSAPTTFASATASAFTLPATRNSRPTMTFGPGSGGGWGSGPGTSSPNPALFGGIAFAIVFCIALCSCLARANMVEQSRQRREAMNSELTAIEAGIPAHMSANAYAHGAAMHQANLNSNTALPSYTAASADVPVYQAFTTTTTSTPSAPMHSSHTHHDHTTSTTTDTNTGTVYV